MESVQQLEHGLESLGVRDYLVTIILLLVAKYFPQQLTKHLLHKSVEHTEVCTIYLCICIRNII